MVYSRGVKFSVALRASSAAESPVIYALLSESSRFKSGVCGQGTISLCTFGCEHKKDNMSHCCSLQAQVCVCAYLRSDTRTGPKLPAGRLAPFASEGLHLFDGEPVWKTFFQTVKIIAGSERRSHAFIVSADWLKRHTDS